MQGNCLEAAGVTGKVPNKCGEGFEVKGVLVYAISCYLGRSWGREPEHRHADVVKHHSHQELLSPFETSGPTCLEKPRHQITKVLPCLPCFLQTAPAVLKIKLLEAPSTCRQGQRAKQKRSTRRVSVQLSLRTHVATHLSFDPKRPDSYTPLAVLRQQGASPAETFTGTQLGRPLSQRVASPRPNLFAICLTSQTLCTRRLPSVWPNICICLRGIGNRHEISPSLLPPLSLFVSLSLSLCLRAFTSKCEPVNDDIFASTAWHRAR